MADIGWVSFKIVIGLVMLAGLISMVFYIFPSLVIIWVGALIYALVMGFSGWTAAILFVFITLLMIIGSLIDNVMMGASAKQTGASWWSLAVAFVASILGSIVWPPFGGLIAAFVGLFIFELIRARDLRQAWESTRSMAFGCGWSTVIRLGIGVLMILLWLAWVLWL